MFHGFSIFRREATFYEGNIFGFNKMQSDLVEYVTLLSKNDEISCGIILSIEFRKTPSLVQLISNI